MPQVLLPETPYDRTALRPGWDELPSEVRAGIEDRLGSAVVASKGSGAGFTPGFVALLNTADARWHFVKAASRSTPVAEWYEQEAKVTAALPDGLPAPALRWSGDVADHLVLCFEAIEGARTPSLPWDPIELQACLDAIAAFNARLNVTKPLDLEPFGIVLDSALCKWRSGQAPGLVKRQEELIALETRFDELTRDSQSLLHCDLRLDNIALDASGRVWICDWSFLCFGPPWFDLVTFLLTAEASGLDPEGYFWSHPLTAGVPPDGLDAALAAILGYYLYAGAQPEIPTSPAVRAHQRYYGKLALRWLSRRLGWA